MRKLDTILLVDDDETTNFFHKFILENEEIASNILEARNGEEALALLSDPGRRQEIDLIFLDVNMPIMNGFEFLESWEQLPNEQRGTFPILMLTTSSHFADKERAETFMTLSGYYNKPLTKEVLQKICLEHFNEAS